MHVTHAVLIESQIEFTFKQIYERRYIDEIGEVKSRLNCSLAPFRLLVDLSLISASAFADVQKNPPL